MDLNQQRTRMETQGQVKPLSNDVISGNNYENTNGFNQDSRSPSENIKYALAHYKSSATLKKT